MCATTYCEWCGDRVNHGPKTYTSTEGHWRRWARITLVQTGACTLHSHHVLSPSPCKVHGPILVFSIEHCSVTNTA